MSPKYQIIVKDKEGNVIGEFSDFFNLRFSDILNNYSQATFDVPITSSDSTKLISLRRFEIDIVRNGVVVWSGEQANADVTLKANSPNLITITSYTYIEMLNARFTPEYVRYDATDQGEILKDLVDVSQAKTDGDLGFTFDSIPATKDRDRDYKLDNIMEAFINMSNVIDGIDFWVDKDKVIRFAEERGIDKSNQYGLEWGVNIEQMRITDNFSSPANTVYAIGSSDGITQLIQSYADASARATYKLREQTLSAIDVSEADTLLGKAQDLVEKNRNLVRTVKIDQIPNTSPGLDKISIGDYINVKIQKGRYDIDGPFRILGYETTLGNTGEERTSWVLADFVAIVIS